MDETTNDSISGHFRGKLTFSNIIPVATNTSDEKVSCNYNEGNEPEDYGEHFDSSEYLNIEKELVGYAEHSSDNDENHEVHQIRSASTKNRDTIEEYVGAEHSNEDDEEYEDNHPRAIEVHSSSSTVPGMVSEATTSATASTVGDKTCSPTASASGDKTKRKRIYRKKNLTRKRQKLHHMWIDTQAKKARSSGQAGEGRKGKEIKVRKMGYGCKTTCRFKCREKITKKSRKRVFKDFWNLQDKAKQWQCINNWLVPVTAQSDEDDSYNETDEEHDKNTKKWSYTLPSCNGSVTVCRTMFLDTLGRSFFCFLKDIYSN